MMSGIKKLIGGIVSPKIGITFLHNRIESTLNTTINEFEMHYNAIQNIVFFLIVVNGEKRRYPFDDAKKLCETITEYVSTEIKEGDKIDYLILRYLNGESNAELYFTDKEGTKNKINQTL